MPQTRQTEVKKLKEKCRKMCLIQKIFYRTKKFYRYHSTTSFKGRLNRKIFVTKVL